MTEQANFKFDTHDLEIIHDALSRWCAVNKLSIADKKAVAAARIAFKLYRQGVEETELAEMLEDALAVGPKPENFEITRRDQ